MSEQSLAAPLAWRDYYRAICADEATRSGWYSAHRHRSDPDRDIDILWLRWKEWKLRMIAKRYDLSIERTRQIEITARRRIARYVARYRRLKSDIRPVPDMRTIADLYGDVDV